VQLGSAEVAQLEGESHRRNGPGRAPPALKELLHGDAGNEAPRLGRCSGMTPEPLHGLKPERDLWL
jgi:hypothetical protein